jgi:hypothetical protein
MNSRILLAGLLGGLVLFAWEFVAHMATPLGEAGMKKLRNEAAVMAALKQSVPTGGLYFFPAPDERPGMTAQEKEGAMRAQEAAMHNGPVGLLMYHARGLDALTPGQLGVQFGADIAMMLLAAFLAAQLPASAGFIPRLVFVTLLALVPALRAHLPMWNWYGFPRRYIAAQIAIDAIGFLLGGLIVARMTQNKPKSMAATS